MKRVFRVKKYPALKMILSQPNDDFSTATYGWKARIKRKNCGAYTSLGDRYESLTRLDKKNLRQQMIEHYEQSVKFFNA